MDPFDWTSFNYAPAKKIQRTVNATDIKIPKKHCPAPDKTQHLFHIGGGILAGVILVKMFS